MKHRWLLRTLILAGLLLTVGWMSRDPAWSISDIEGLGSVRVMGLTEGTRHEVPGVPGLLNRLPTDWRDSLAREMGYKAVSWGVSDLKEELLVWCDWKLTATLPPGGWFEPLLVDASGQVIAQGTYPAVGYVPGRHIEPIRFPVRHVESGTLLQIRRFQPGSPYRDLVAQVRLHAS